MTTEDLFTADELFAVRAARALRRRGCAVCNLRSTTLVCPDCASDVGGSLAWLATRMEHATDADDRERIDKARQILRMQ